MFRYPKINVIIYGGEGARKKCVVHGAFDRSTFGCTVIVLDPALNRNPSSVSPRYMQTRLLTVVNMHLSYLSLYDVNCPFSQNDLPLKST